MYKINIKNIKNKSNNKLLIWNLKSDNAITNIKPNKPFFNNKYKNLKNIIIINIKN